MDVKLDGGLFVTLSERNLRDLLAQWEEGRQEASLYRLTDKGFLSVAIEANDVHYKNRQPGPGSGLVPQL